MEKLSSSDITVVIQGQIHKDMKKVLKSIRRFLPSAEIILSTWKNSDVEGLQGLYDKLVLNDDCGGVIFETEENKLNNLNRILISTQNGIKEANRKYILRLRSDLCLKNDDILKLTDFLPKRVEEKSLFKKRIFAYDIFSIKYDAKKNVKQRMLFHISDWCYFGLNEDIKELFNVPLVQEPEFSQHFKNNQKLCEDIHSYRLWKMSPEQYLTSTNAKKVFANLEYGHYLDNTEENIKISEDFIINNFVVFSSSQWGIKTLKKEYKDVKLFANNPFDYYSKLEQQKDYKKYCDKDFKISLDWTIKLYDIKYFEKLRKHFYMLMLGSLWRKPSQLASCLYYLVQFIIAIVKGALCQKK